MEQVSCLLCGSDDYRVSMRAPSYNWRTEFTVCTCNRCQLSFVNPRPSDSEIGAFYPAGYHSAPLQLDSITNRGKYWIQYCILQASYGWPARTRPAIARLLAANLEPYLGRAFPFSNGRRLLDIGSGNGEFLLWVRQLDPSWVMTGVEPSASATEMARESGLTIMAGSLESQEFPDNSFDIVTMWNVLEHLHDPLATLREIRRVLIPGGYLALIVPNVGSPQATRFGRDWWVLQLPQHLTFFTFVTLREMLERADFRIIRLQSRRVTYSYMSLKRQRQFPQFRSVPSQSRIMIERVLDFFREGDVIKAIAQAE